MAACCDFGLEEPNVRGEEILKLRSRLGVIDARRIRHGFIDARRWTQPVTECDLIRVVYLIGPITWPARSALGMIGEVQSFFLTHANDERTCHTSKLELCIRVFSSDRTYEIRAPVFGT